MASILYRFRVIARFSSKVTNINPPNLHLSPPMRVTPFEFRGELWSKKTRIKVLSCGIICVILRLAVLIQYRSVTDIQTHTHTHTHRDSHTSTAYTALSIASRGKTMHQNLQISTPYFKNVMRQSLQTCILKRVPLYWPRRSRKPD